MKVQYIGPEMLYQSREISRRHRIAGSVKGLDAKLGRNRKAPDGKLCNFVLGIFRRRGGHHAFHSMSVQGLRQAFHINFRTPIGSGAKQ